MENSITIKQNDAFLVLQTITKLSAEDLEKQIITNLVNERIFYATNEDCGLTANDLAQDNGYATKEFIKVILPGYEESAEIPELLKGVLFWGLATNDPCECCGCELESENETQEGHTWTNKTCENSECGFKDSNEPDWD